MADNINSSTYNKKNNNSKRNKNRYINNKLTLWTSEAKIHGKAYKHLKVNLDFIISGKKKEKRGEYWYAFKLLEENGK